MDFKILFTTFWLIFLAELGDKTQLAAFCLATDCNSKTTVFIGSALALVLSSFLAVYAGDAVSRVIPAIYLKTFSGVLFIGTGIWILFKSATCPI